MKLFSSSAGFILSIQRIKSHWKSALLSAAERREKHFTGQVADGKSVERTVVAFLFYFNLTFAQCWSDLFGLNELRKVDASSGMDSV